MSSQITRLPSPVDLFLSSAYASNYLNGTFFNSDLIFQFNPINGIQDTDFRVKLINFVFPVSFYLVDANNNNLNINGVNYTLTNGNYNVTTFAAMLTTVTGLTITYNTSNGLFTFKRTTPSFYFGSQSTCLTLLGFPEATTTSVSTLIGGFYTLVSTQVVNLSGQYNTIYIDFTNVSSGNLSSQNGRSTSVFASIPVNQPQGNLVYFVNQTDSHSIIQESSLSLLHIRIVGEDLVTPVCFNGVNWNMNIEISYVPHKPIPKSLNFVEQQQQNTDA